MQTTDPAFPTGPERHTALPVQPSTGPDQQPDGDVADDEGSAAYVSAWDAHLRRTAAAGDRTRRDHNVRLAREILETAIFALIMFLGVRLVVQNFRVEGLSMDPTYETGQYVLVNKALYSRINLEAISDWVPFWQSDDSAHYIFRRPHRGDVVVFEPPIAPGGERDFIKRVIGEPGDRVEIRDGRVLVNGFLLEEGYLPPVQTTCFGQYCDVTLGADQYFVLGDNRPNSSDSRYWGPVNGGSIIGRALLIYLPFSDFGPAPNGTPTLAAPASD
jgi:signal peptidase I